MDGHHYWWRWNGAPPPPHQSESLFGRTYPDRNPRTPQLSRAQVYEGLAFKLALKFPTGYPYEAPTVTFNPPSCFHPNVDQYGNICLDILKVREGWAARGVVVGAG